MGMKRTALVAGLALGLMSGTAEASSVTYSIDISLEGKPVTGSITTDGLSGYLTGGDVTGYNFEYNGTSVNDSKSRIYSQSPALYVFQSNIYFDFSGDGIIAFYQDNISANFLMVGADKTSSKTGEIYFYSKPTNVEGDGYTGFKIIGTSSSDVGGVAPPSTVPLPTSAPMFGAALLALGAVGYGVKRKKAAASA